ncbi:hypothetical protein [Dyella sp. AD56]|uniref:hypothetical protein n=1 Tax=Dyella sp. AD56 TaxID=1528744 RepID=UPI0011AF8DE7|nr:hypothetical protein [Dyella sp. AD56]
MNDNVVNTTFYHAKQRFGARQQSHKMTPAAQLLDAAQHDVNKSFYNKPEGADCQHLTTAAMQHEAVPWGAFRTVVATPFDGLFVTKFDNVVLSVDNDACRFLYPSGEGRPFGGIGPVQAHRSAAIRGE